MPICMPHIHEKIDFTADVFVVHARKVLLRMHDKYHRWFAPGGHIELDEDPNQAAIRETKEEVGLDIELYTPYALAPNSTTNVDLIPPIFLNRHRISATHEHISFVYFATTKNPTVRVTYDADRSDTWKWFSAAELLDPVFDIPITTQFHALEALRRLGTYRM